MHCSKFVLIVINSSSPRASGKTRFSPMRDVLPR